MVDVLPNCLARERRGIVMRDGAPWVPIFCANCGADGGLVLEESVDTATGFAFYLCNPCAEDWAPLAGTMLVPDEVFWAELVGAQHEKYGRELTHQELIDQLAQPDSMISTLARSRAAMTPNHH